MIRQHEGHAGWLVQRSPPWTPASGGARGPGGSGGSLAAQDGCEVCANPLKLVKGGPDLTVAAEPVTQEGEVP